jgi:S1-C subfamily serine protease
MNMRRTLHALFCGGCCVIAATTFAQTSSTETPQQQTEQLMRELERARREIEKAAQEMAGLYVQQASEFSADIKQDFDAFLARSFLGVVIEDTELGARVTAVTPNGPAASAGVLVGDTIVTIDGIDLTRQPGQPPSAPERMLTQMQRAAPGGTVNLRVLRGGDYRDVAVAIPGDGRGWFNFEMPPGWLDSMNSWTSAMFVRTQPWSDFEFVALTPELGEYFGTDKGLLVVRAPDGDALGFRDGDVILDIGGREPQSPEHALRILGSFEPGESLRVSIMRKQVRQTLEIKIPGEAADGAWTSRLPPAQ